jgi:adenylate cyclase
MDFFRKLLDIQVLYFVIMNSIRKPIKHQLILDRFSANDPESADSFLSENKISNLKKEKVQTIFIISAEKDDTREYASLVSRYENEGFRIRKIHIASFDNSTIPYVKHIVEEIKSTFRRESCMVVSYGRSLAPMIIACYYVYSGTSPSRAITRVRQMDDYFLAGIEEVALVYKFKHYLNAIQGISDDAIIFKPLLQPEIAGEIPAAEIDKTAETEPEINLDDIPDIEALEKQEMPQSMDAGIALDIPLPDEDELDLKHPSRSRKADIALDTAKPMKLEPAGEPAIALEPGPDSDEPALPDVAEPEKPIGTGEPPAPAFNKAEYIERTVEKGEGRKTKPGTDEHIQKEMPAKMTTSEREGRNLGIYSIRFKLVTIISAIIIAALTGMIFLATYFFKRDNELRAWESNQKFSEVTALKVKSDFISIIERSRLIPGIIARLNPDEKASIWDNDEDFLFIGIAAKGGASGRLTYVKSIVNTALMEKNGIPLSDLQGALDTFGPSFEQSLKGEIAIHNVSRSFRIPITGFSLPLYRDARGTTDRILVSIIRLDRILKAFKSAGLVNVIMVNDKGDIIAHPDGTVVISGGNYLKLPIVRLMMKSPLDNGQMRYDDANGTAYLGSFKKIGIGGCGVIATIQESRAYEQVYRIQRWNLYLLVIILTIAILIVYIFGKAMATPIRRLVKATERIKEGNYSIDIMPTTRDEIGLLTGSFIEMGHGLAEREKMKEAFGKFVNKDIAERVLKGEIALGGERKNVAIFFSDIRNFTAISEKLEPEEVVEFLNQYMTRMVNCVNETRGVVDKYIGDAIMAVWGAPVSTGNDTENAVNAALAMRKELLLFNKGRGGDKNPVIKIGCGINTGPVLAGQIGSEERMEYTVIGDAVNLASRIETLTKPFGTDILVSEDSYRLIKGIFRTVPMQKITVKGKKDPQQIYAVLGRLDDPDEPATIEELRAILGTKEQPFRRRHDDPHQEEVKYEIIDT